ncbi:MAG: polyribonucleotide nucleotidyltransferase, partial [bacterium]
MATYEFTQGGKRIRLEFGTYAKQADGAVMVSIEDSYLLVAVTVTPEPVSTEDFFPLTVEYREKAYASGRIPGGFFKREGKPTEKEILSSRLIDRAIRPLFPKDFRNELQVNLSVVCYDGENDPDIMGILGASAALVSSSIPFNGPIGGVRIGYIDSKYIINPTSHEQNESLIDVVIAGTGDSILMVEGSAKEIPESLLLGAFEFALPYLQKQVEIQTQIASELGKQKLIYEVNLPPPELVELVKTKA